MLTAQSLREVLGLFPTGIAVVTAIDPQGDLFGVTINSFSSVSLEPPLVLFSLSRTRYALKAMFTTGAFAIHFLREDQGHISARFSKAIPNKWEHLKYREGVTGCPVIEPALAVLECRLYAQYEGGDHVIILGRIEHIERQLGGNPLVFFQGRYHRIGGESPLPVHGPEVGRP